MRVAVLWSHRSGYLDASLDALRRELDGSLLLSYRLPDVDHAPFVLPDPPADLWLAHRSVPRASDLMPAIRQFAPDVILINGWQVPGHRAVARHWRGRAIRVLCMDNQWRGTAKQRLGVLSARAYLHPYFDLAFVPGERQRQFAMRLGFRGEDIIPGLLSADWDALSVVGRRRVSWPERFLYVGRLSPEKGVRVLLDAYRLYRSEERSPWPVRFVGSGPFVKELADLPGVEHRGFVQPQGLAAEFLATGALVLPSEFEPWGVVVHEAAAAGLPLICSDAVGATAHLVSDHFNGRVVPAGSVEDLADAMRWMSRRSVTERRELGQASQGLAAQFTPELFARRLLSAVEARLR